MGVLKWLFGTTIVLKLIDLATTYYLVNKYGARIESNPFMYDMIGIYGLEWTCLVSMFIYSMLMFLLYKYRKQSLMIVVIIFMSLVAITNFINIIIGAQI